MKEPVPGYIGHRSRIKEKYKKTGLSGCPDYEILELALSYAIPRKNTKQIAKELVDRFKTFNGVLDADCKELQCVYGLSKHSALFLKLLKDISIFYMEKGLHNRDLLTSPQLVYDYLKASLKGLADEEFRMLFLDNRNQLLATEAIQNGTVNQAIVFPRTVVERALYHHAAGVIISHNHPARSLEPSREDMDITKAIKAALRTVEIALLDHIIIGGNEYFSFKESSIVF